MSRRKAREVALQALFTHDIVSTDISKAEAFASSFVDMPSASKEFMHQIIMGTLQNQQKFDKLIDDYAKGWRIERLSSVDRCLLRIALYELSGGTDAPVEVVINETMELAKMYSTPQAPNFINGILGRILSDGALT